MVKFIDKIKQKLGAKPPATTAPASTTTAKTEQPAKKTEATEITQTKPPRKSVGEPRARSRKRNEEKEGKAETEPRKPTGRGRGDSAGSDKPRSEKARTKNPRPPKETKPVLPTEPWDPASFTVEPKEGFTRFHDLNLPEEMLHAIADLGFEYCTPIQAQILPGMLQDKDAIGKAQTGTGKTAAFLTSVYSHLLRKPCEKDRAVGKPRALILAPTRELAMQIEQEAQEIGKYSGLRSLAVFGGMDYGKQKDVLLSSQVDVLVATPGRLIDYRRNQVVDLRQVEILVIDEADRMLDMGFIPDVKDIVRSTPHKDQRQTFFFSATFNDDVLRLADQWTNDPIHIEIEPEKVASENVQQIVYMATAEQRLPIIYHLLKDNEEASRVLIFANRRDRSRRLCEALQDYGFDTRLLTGDVDQMKRVKTLEKFRNGELRIIVATDVAGRGIHVDNVSHVINFELPTEAEDYVHRIGRTGRAGEKGISISFASEDDAFYLPEIEEYLGESLTCTYPDEALLAKLPPRPKVERRRESGGARPGQRSGGGRPSGARSRSGGGRNRSDRHSGGGQRRSSQSRHSGSSGSSSS